MKRFESTWRFFPLLGCSEGSFAQNIAAESVEAAQIVLAVDARMRCLIYLWLSSAFNQNSAILELLEAQIIS